jgi:hypothetical protein
VAKSKKPNTTSQAIQKIMDDLGVQPPGSSDEVVRQRTLKNLETMQLEFKAMEKKFQDMRYEMRETMRQGASVAPGKLGLKSSIVLRRRVSYKSVVIEKLGEAAQKAALEKAPTYAYFHVRLVVPKPK